MEREQDVIFSNEYGSLTVQTKKAFYIEGEQIEGAIQLDLKQIFPGSEIYLLIQGMERTDFSLWSTNKGSHNVHYYKDSKEICNIKTPINSDPLEPGSYTFPFAFRLNKEFPPSFKYGSMESDYGRIEYTLTGKLESREKGVSHLEGKFELLIRSKYIFPEQVEDPPVIGELRKGMSTCGGCISRGTVTMKYSFNKSIYANDEDIPFGVEIDNQKSKDELVEIKCEVIRKYKLLASGWLGGSYTMIILALIRRLRIRQLLAVWGDMLRLRDSHSVLGLILLNIPLFIVNLLPVVIKYLLLLFIKMLPVYAVGLFLLYYILFTLLLWLIRNLEDNTILNYYIYIYIILFMYII